MAENEITITAPDGARYRSYILGNEKPPRPALIVFSAVFGVDADMEQLAQRWADRGYLVAVPDYYHRVKSGPLARTDEGRAAAMARWKALDIDMAMADARALKEQLLALPSCNGQVAVLGICAGGELAVLAASRLGVQAAAAYHGTHIERHLDEAAGIEVPVSLHFGGNDSLVPLDQVAAIKERLGKLAHVDVEVYAGAEHGFSSPGRPSYHPHAATESDRRAQQIFEPLKTPA